MWPETCLPYYYNDLEKSLTLTCIYCIFNYRKKERQEIHMLRFARYCSKYAENKEKERVFMEKVASRTIINGLRDVYDPGLDYLWHREYDPVRDKDLLCGLILGYFPDDFFGGVSHCFIIGNDPASANDLTVGSWLIRKKVDRLVEKLEDCRAEYYLDIFEQLLLAVAVKFVQKEIARMPERKRAYFNDFGYATALYTLTGEFGYPVDEAKEKASAVTYFGRMLSADAEEEKEYLFFQDSDYEIFYNESFLDGLEHLENYIGEMMGYGYDYVCRIFEDAGIDIPIDALGTKEENEIVNLLQKEQLMDQISQIFDRN
ncbi:MAG: hypothetical protein LUG93_10165 [Lachnospiraceae bacterium]|nr:hypothetical protein [Lachnospiraceae bacterium]